ncbi:MAG: hypothetical protein ACE5Q6_12480 [Dehalococcoidia bacterium]
MVSQGRRPEPVGRLSDYLVVVTSCIRCKTRMPTSFRELAQQQRLSCQRCGLSWDFNLDRADVDTLDQYFRRLEDPIRDSEAWVELNPYP